MCIARISGAFHVTLDDLTSYYGHLRTKLLSENELYR